MASDTTTEFEETTTGSIDRPFGGLSSPEVKCQTASHGAVGKVLRWIKLDGLVILFDQGCCSITTFLCGVFVARACSKDEYALYVLGFTLLMVVQLVQHSIVSIPFTVHSPQMDLARSASYFGSKVIHQATLSTVTIAGLVGTAVLLHMIRLNSHMTGMLLGLSVGVFGLLMRDFMRYILLARLQIWSSLLMGLMANFATLIGLYWAYSSGRLSAAFAYIIVGFSSALPAMLAVISRRREVMIQRSQVVRDLKRDWRFGRWLLISYVANSFGVQSMPWLLLLFYGSESVAIMGVLIAITGFIRPIVIGADAYLVPKLANRLKDGGLRSATKAGTVAFAAMGGAMLAYVLSMALWGEALVGVFYTERYQGHAGSLVFMAVAMGLIGTNIPLRALLRVTNRPKAESFASVCGSLVMILAGLSLVPWCGILGASIAISIGNLAFVCINKLAISRVTK